MNHKKPLTDKHGEVRELTSEDMAEMVPFTALPAKLQATLRKIGRPASDVKKKSISIRLDPDVLDAIKATGDGWQTRVNDVLRRKFLKNRAAPAAPIIKKAAAKIQKAHRQN
jgi:uncharacterized protein (DUF4415 family)